MKYIEKIRARNQLETRRILFKMPRIRYTIISLSVFAYNL